MFMVIAIPIPSLVAVCRVSCTFIPRRVEREGLTNSFRCEGGRALV